MRSSSRGMGDIRCVSPVADCATASIPIASGLKNAHHTTVVDSSIRRGNVRLAESVAARNQMITERRNATNPDALNPQLNAVHTVLSDPTVEKILDTPLPLPTPVIESVGIPGGVDPSLIPAEIQHLKFGDIRASGCQLSKVPGEKPNDWVYAFISCMDIYVSCKSSPVGDWCKLPFHRVSLTLRIVCKNTIGTPTVHTNTVQYYSRNSTWDDNGYKTGYFPESHRVATKQYIDLVRDYTKDAVVHIALKHCVRVRIINDDQYPASSSTDPFTFDNRAITRVKFNTTQFHDIVPRAVAAVTNPINHKW